MIPSPLDGKIVGRLCQTPIHRTGVSQKRPYDALRLFQLKDCAAYNLIVDLDVNAISAHSECTRTQIVDVLAAIDPEVRARVGRAAVNGLIDLSGRTPGSSGQSNSRRWQVATPPWVSVNLTGMTRA
jgi:hypothetical protein